MLASSAVEGFSTALNYCNNSAVTPLLKSIELIWVHDVCRSLSVSRAAVISCVAFFRVKISWSLFGLNSVSIKKQRLAQDKAKAQPAEMAME